MRLHSLTLRAIGPYVDEQRVDFDALGRDGLFLFAGPTGVGKSSILDAVTFALYGVLPGARRGLDGRLKSDFAAHDVRPYVVLELSVDDRRWKLTRSPQYERPKKRGDGMTTERASVALEEWVDGGWIGVEDGRIEAVVAAWVDEHVRLGIDQFSQVVVLPQGQFAQFLHCKDTERETLLSSLFHADRYRNVEKWLEDKARTARESAAEARERVAVVIAKTVEAAGIDASEVPTQPTDEWYAELVSDADRELMQRRAAQSEAAAAARVALEQLQAEQRVAELVEERATLTRRRKALDDRRPEYDGWVRELADAVSVAPLEPMLAELEERVSQDEESATAEHRAVRDVAAGVPDIDVHDTGALKRRAARLARERGALESLIELEDSLPARHSAVDEATVALDRARGVRVQRQEQRDELPGQLAEARTQLTALEATAATEAALRDEVSALRDARTAAEEAARLAGAIASTKAALEDAREQANAAKELWLELAERQLSGIHAQLAAQLVEGQACGVCGSCSHPQPATVTFVVPDSKEVEAAKAECAVLETARDATDSDLQRLNAQHAALAALTGGRATAEIDAALADVERRASEAARAGAQLPELRSLIAEAEVALAGADDELRSADRDVVARESELDAARVRLAELSDQISEARGGFASIRERAEDLDRLIQTIEQYLDSHAVARAAQRERARLETAISEQIAARGFDKVDAAAEAIRTDQQQTELRRRITSYDADLAAVREQLADQRLAQVPEDPPELEPLVAASEAAHEVEMQAGAAVRSAESVSSRLRALRTQASVDLADASTVAARAERVDELAKLARGLGANSKGMSLTSYFLAARLDEVAAEASSHLLRMTSGRYELEHTDERTSKRGRGGLGLRVIDNFTGISRTPQSLSGGETFTASLALALALADVVTAEAGAMSIDSLFIDEGFGSLDSDYLDAALDVLDSLRAAGRTIGVISHVEEMKHRIPAQLVIERAERGSVIRAHS